MYTLGAHKCIRLILLLRNIAAKQLKFTQRERQSVLSSRKIKYNNTGWSELGLVCGGEGKIKIFGDKKVKNGSGIGENKEIG